MTRAPSSGDVGPSGIAIAAPLPTSVRAPDYNFARSPIVTVVKATVSERRGPRH